LRTQKIIIITAPSGSGKTTLVKRLLVSLPQLSFSVSACTRKPRENEVNGKDYYFIEANEFRELINENAFAEWEMVYTDKYYGTLKKELERIWNEGKTPLVDIDVKGARSIMKTYPEQCKSIFIMPPSVDELRNRLRNRGTETERSLEERIAKASEELNDASQFNSVVVNDKLEMAYEQLYQLVTTYLQ
jgi:guanylate kinase